MRDHLAEFNDATVVIVTFAAPHRLGAYREHLGIDCAVLSDPELKLYQLLGAGRATRRRVWSRSTLRMYARLLRQGRRLSRPTEDVNQLGADVVVGRDGRIRYLALPPGPDARPPVGNLIAALD